MALEHLARPALGLAQRSGQFGPHLGRKPHGGQRPQLPQFGLAQLADALIGPRDALCDVVFLAPYVAQRIIERPHGLRSAYTHCSLTIG